MSWPPGDVDPAATPQREGQTVSLSQSVKRGTMYPSAAGDDRLPVLIQAVYQFTQSRLRAVWKQFTASALKMALSCQRENARLLTI